MKKIIISPLVTATDLLRIYMNIPKKALSLFIIGIIAMYCMVSHTEEFEQRTDFPPLGRIVPSEYVEIENYH